MKESNYKIKYVVLLISWMGLVYEYKLLKKIMISIFRIVNAYFYYLLVILSNLLKPVVNKTLPSHMYNKSKNSKYVVKCYTRFVSSKYLHYCQ